MFRNRKYYNVDLSDWNRRIKRYVEVNFTYRKCLLTLFCLAITILYIGPYIFQWLFNSPKNIKDPLLRCMDDRLTPYYSKAMDFNAYIIHYAKSDDGKSSQYAVDQRNIPYIGNGWFGLEVSDDASFFVKYGRHLSESINYQPITVLNHKPDMIDDFTSELDTKQAVVVDYLSGIVHKFQCSGNDFFISQNVYAHRVIPQILVQEIKITNLRNSMFNIDLVAPLIPDWLSMETRELSLKQSGTVQQVEYFVMSGIIDLKKNNQVLLATIITQKLPSKLSIKRRGITKLDIIHLINYSIVTKHTSNKQKATAVESAAIELWTKVLQDNKNVFYLLVNENADALSTTNPFKMQHKRVWKHLWESGFQISTSMADNVINGDQINATIYAVLSQARSFEFESSTTEQFRTEISKSLFYSEGCYDSYHTLQAKSLWRDMQTIEEMNKVVMSWLLTLEKQGCHHLIKAGASGILQAMVLSFGGFRFSNQHLEFNIHPKYLHRDYFFRRLNYGNMTHINVSVEVTDENRAILYVALDRSDGKYYACDAGCLDEPISLSQERTMFPVKLTEPLTSILYIAADKQHIEELRHAIHVKEVVEAPAHENHIIALHKHGNQLGGLPTFFWVSIFAIIIVFHVFLCKLIVKEYCEPPEKLRYRYDKP